MLIRFRPDVLNLKPKAVVILAGTNDIAGNTGPMTDEDIQNNLISMSELAKTAGVKVVLSSITPTSAYHVGPSGIPQTTTRPLARIRALNEWMKSYAASAGHVYLDYFSSMVDTTGAMKSELTNDDLHPNAAGYAVMAPLAQAAIDRALTVIRVPDSTMALSRSRSAESATRIGALIAAAGRRLASFASPTLRMRTREPASRPLDVIPHGADERAVDNPQCQHVRKVNGLDLGRPPEFPAEKAACPPNPGAALERRVHQLDPLDSLHPFRLTLGIEHHARHVSRRGRDVDFC